MTSASKPSRSDELRRRLLLKTIEHAVANSPFYRSRLSNVAADVREPADLRKLPLLRKSELREHIDELKCFGGFPDYVMYTSGTTGEPLAIPVLHSQLEASDALLSHWVAAIGKDIPLTLALPRPIRGSHIRNRGLPSIVCNIFDGSEKLIEALESTHWMDGKRVRIRALEANVLNLRRVTREFLHNGIEPGRFGLEIVITFGQYLTGAERRLLEEVWRADIVERYGLTEVQGDSRRCRRCGYYHFDFIVIPEVLDPGTGEPIEDGIGHLVLTGLYPFNDAVPMIRYFVEDIVEIRKTDCGSAEPGIRFLSRIKHAVEAPPGSGARYRVFSTDVAEALASLPDVARKEKNTLLKFKLSSTDAGEARVEIELAYPPALYPARVDELRGSILRVLRERSASVGDPEIVFLEPKQLREVTMV